MTLYTKKLGKAKKEKEKREPGVLHVAVKMPRDKDEEAIRLIDYRTWESERSR